MIQPPIPEGWKRLRRSRAREVLQFHFQAIEAFIDEVGEELNAQFPTRNIQPSIRRSQTQQTGVESMQGHPCSLLEPWIFLVGYWMFIQTTFGTPTSREFAEDLIHYFHRLARIPFGMHDPFCRKPVVSLRSTTGYLLASRRLDIKSAAAQAALRPPVRLPGCGTHEKNAPAPARCHPWQHRCTAHRSQRPIESDRRWR